MASVSEDQDADSSATGKCNGALDRRRKLASARRIRMLLLCNTMLHKERWNELRTKPGLCQRIRDADTLCNCTATHAAKAPVAQTNMAAVQRIRDADSLQHNAMQLRALK
jgi:hypothetical protein